MYIIIGILSLAICYLYFELKSMRDEQRNKHSQLLRHLSNIRGRVDGAVIQLQASMDFYLDGKTNKNKKE